MRNVRRVVMLMLIVVLIAQCSVGVFASEINKEEYIVQINLSDVLPTKEEALAYAYEGLCPEAKMYFDARITQSEALQEVHRQYINENYVSVSTASQYATRNAVTVVAQQLSLLNLPSEVQYALEAFASSLLVSASDGVLPYCDIYTLAVSAYLFVVLADHWDEVHNSFDDIVDAFVAGFSAFLYDINVAFDSIYDDAAATTEYPSFTLRRQNDNVYIGSERYYCSKLAETVRPGKAKFYVGVRADNNKLFFCMSKTIAYPIAKAIIDYNDGRIGTLAENQSLAETLCDYPYIHHSPHDMNDLNYLPHFHRMYSFGEGNAHSWYPRIS